MTKVRRGPRRLRGDGGMHIAFVSTFPPRRCGIATFTNDLSRSLLASSATVRTSVIAMTDAGAEYTYPDRVRFEIRQGVKGDYTRAAEFVNFSDAGLVSIQHEYGIFGGASGAHLLDFLGALQTPAIVTLHTVLKSPTTGQRAVVRKIADRCRRVVVMSQLAVELLRSVYDIEEGKVVMIPHGILDMPLGERDHHKRLFGVEDRRVLLTFGLLSPNKGVETVIRAMPELLKKHPDMVYLVVGATHPDVKRRFGEQYRNGLEREAESLGVRDHVVFRDQFVEADELKRYLQAADIYITPYLNEAQITSGTLAYAMGSGAAVVSTPYWHAKELLAGDRGRLFDFGDVEALSKVIDELLSDREVIAKAQNKAHRFARSMTWPRVGARYVELAAAIIEETPAPARSRRVSEQRRSLPELRLDHLIRMTDDTGMLQHAVYTVPDRRHGYCVDDNARALLVALLAHRVSGSDATQRLITTTLSYLRHSQRSDGRFSNFMDFRRELDTDTVSEDCDGRAMWALGAAVRLAPQEGERRLATQMFEQIMERPLTYGPHGQALAIIGLDAFLHAEREHDEARSLLQQLTACLIDAYGSEADEHWRWFEPVITYDNALLPYALFKAHESTGDPEALRIASESLAFLEEICFAQGHLTLIGNAGWHRRDSERVMHDEQPLDAAAFVLAFRAAYRTTKDKHSLDRMRDSFEWFLGANRLEAPLYDFATAGCRDGLHLDDVNANEGAESTLAFLLSLLAMLDVAPTRSAREKTHDIEQVEAPSVVETTDPSPAAPIGMPR